MPSTLMTTTIVSLTARTFLVLTLTISCAGTALANRPEFRKPGPMQRSTASLQNGQVADPKPEGDWEGTLDAGPAKVRIVLHITRKEGPYGATLDSPDQGALGIPIETVTVNGDSIKMDLKSLRATYEGKLARDGSSIAGVFTQGQAVPLTFTRVASTGANPTMVINAIREMVIRQR